MKSLLLALGLLFSFSAQAELSPVFEIKLERRILIFNSPIDRHEEVVLVQGDPMRLGVTFRSQEIPYEDTTVNFSFVNDGLVSGEIGVFDIDIRKLIRWGHLPTPELGDFELNVGDGGFYRVLFPSREQLLRYRVHIRFTGRYIDAEESQVL